MKMWLSSLIGAVEAAKAIERQCSEAMEHHPFGASVVEIEEANQEKVVLTHNVGGYTTRITIENVEKSQ